MKSLGGVNPIGIIVIKFTFDFGLFNFTIPNSILRQPPVSQPPLSTARWWEDGMKRSFSFMVI